MLAAGSESSAAFCAQFIVTPKGTGALEPILLRPWQIELVGPVFDAKSGRILPDGRCCEGQGKSKLATPLRLYDLLLEEEGASTAVTASDERRAGIVFEIAYRMVELNEARKPDELCHSADQASEIHTLRAGTRETVVVVINIRLSEVKTVMPDDRDSLGRTQYGYDPAMSDAQLWADNRGRYSVSDARLRTERYAAFVFEGRVVAVAELAGHEIVDHPNSSTHRKIALKGHPLGPGDRVYDALIGADRGRARYTIWYTPDPFAAPADLGNTVLLTSNPLLWDWGDAHLDAVDRTASGEQVEDRWSAGSRKTGLRHGDRAFLLRQGEDPRGVIASGRVTGAIYQDDHWDGSARDANYVDVEWDLVLSPEDVLLRADLETAIPAQEWSPQGSGTLVRGENATMLEQVWAEHVAGLGAEVALGGNTRGQGRILDPVLRKKIEDAAQDRLSKQYESDHWEVEDTRYGHPYDAVARKGDQVVYLEAKGTTTPGRSVTITRRELEHARNHPGACVIGIWSGMAFLDDGEIDPASGQFVVLDFDPDEGSLEIIDYRWTPSA
jgi:hypothetical protein